MTNSSFDKYLDTKLKKSEVISTSPDFTGNLMKRIRDEYSFDSELKRTDRTANLVVGFFASLMLLVVLVLVFAYFSANPSEVYRIGGMFGNFDETLTGYFRALTSVLSSPITLAIILSSFIYFFADQFLLVHKKSRRSQ
jgi:Na+/proline symporter